MNEHRQLEHRAVMVRVSNLVRDYADLPMVSGNSVLYIHLNKLRPDSDERGFYLWEDHGLCRAMPRFSMMSILFDTVGSAHIGLLEEWRPVPVLDRPRLCKDRMELEALMEAHVCLSSTSVAPWTLPPEFLGPDRSLYSARLFCRDTAPFMWRFQFSKMIDGRLHVSNHLEASCDMLDDWRHQNFNPRYTPA